MKKLPLFLIAVIAVLSLTAYMPASDWHQVEAKIFSIEFPDEPEFSSETIDTDVGKVAMDFFMYSDDIYDDNLVYSAITSEYPDNAVHSSKTSQLKTVFQNVITSTRETLSGELLSEKEISIDGFPGREVRIKYKDGENIMRMRVYLINNTMVMLQIVTEKESDGNEAILQFFNSFKLKK